MISPATAPGTAAGLSVQRVWTTEGAHPYDEVEWGTRDVILTNWRDGSVNFEQKGVEFPVDWEDNAVNIVTTKYFYGAMGSPEREYSLKQLINRVVSVYAETGRSNGYFVTDDDAVVFGHELTYMLIHQIFSFNSPVWFNVGTPSKQAVSACYILSVDDTMESILNWYAEEGMIFKGGSGAGVNLSRIRSSKELMSGRGTASGPVSFMQGADSIAGAIKSGGTTRRAAKLVCLDVDHPDVEEFIDLKVREEQKIRALRDAGFDMDLGGADMYSVQYQNANNSVRVSDEFMRCVHEGRQFVLRNRKGGSPAGEVNARELMRKMAQAAWACADPGIQYDTTINDWHTCPETGPITASNPCSEYMHLDNSSCNLASLNLLKFLQDDNGFDTERFTRSAELIVTAMDISICFADYPTEKIGATTRAYRELGIGYANLGALLMSSGMAYDSQDGREYAAAIAALMTGTAYKRSAELAAAVGPYEGYVKNAAAHRRVIRKHKDACAQLMDSAERGVLDVVLAAEVAWYQAESLGTGTGYRNSQVSVIAPTGTIGLAMSCDTTGIEPALSLATSKKLVGGGSMKFANRNVTRALQALGYTPEGIAPIARYVADNGHVMGAPGLDAVDYPVFDCAMGERSIRPMGHVLMMAAVQPFLSGSISKCVTGDTLVPSSEGLIRISSLHEGEAEDSFRPEQLIISSLGSDQKTDAFYYGGVRPVRRAGLRSGHSITGTYPHRLLVSADEGVQWKALAEIQEGDSVAVQYGADLWSDTPADLTGITTLPVHGSQTPITLPSAMTEELAFLLGAYASEGHTSRSNWTVTITNPIPEVIERVKRAWLSEFGLNAKVTNEDNKCMGIVISSETVVEFMEGLGCGLRSSAKRIPDVVLRSPRNMVIEFMRGLALDAYTTTIGGCKWAICLDSKKCLDDIQAVMTNLGVVTGRSTKHNKEYDKDFDEVYAAGPWGQLMCSLVPFMEPYKAERAAEYQQKSFKQASTDDDLHFSPVVSITDAGEAEVYDLSVPGTHAFVANGIMNHNTVNMPESATVEDIEEIYVKGWELGLKSLAVYRDNCKVGQPISVSKPAAVEAQAPAAAPADVHAGSRPVRKRLPRTRGSLTTSFRVGETKGYLTSSRYPDDGIGEMFLRMSKQGSTLAGMMDAFSIAVSLGLQHGVPLETYVSKFVGTRFEPLGMTDDPDLRIASSIMDYVFRRLALDYLPFEAREELGILSSAERTAQLDGADPAAAAQTAPAAPAAAPRSPAVNGHAGGAQARTVDAPLCLSCGTGMRRAGSCYVCGACGATSGCS